jgi:tRNA A-37 threonylcarbamoyl transferase component Bud32
LVGSIGSELEADEVLSLGVRNGVFTTRDKETMFQRLIKGERPVLPSDAVAPPSSVPRHLQTPRDQKRSAARSYMTPGTDATPTTGLMMTPGAVGASTNSTGFSARKATLLSTPASGTRLPTGAQTTARKGTPSSRIFNLGGPPLRVAASEAEADDDGRDSLLDDDDDEGMGMKEEPHVRIKNEPLSPTREAMGAFKLEPGTFQPEETTLKQESQSSHSMTTATAAATPQRRQPPTTTAAPTTASKAGKDLSYIKNWAPRPISSMSSSSRAPSFDHNNPDLYPTPKRRNLGTTTSSEKGDIGASGPQIRLDPNSPVSASSVSSSSSPLSSADGSGVVPRDPFAKLTSKVIVNGSTYIKLEQIGSGGSSKVYRMLGPDLKIYALKKIKLKRLDPKSVEQYTNEIQLLKRLQGNPFIIRLISAEQDMKERVIHVLMEHGEIDLGERLRELNDGLDENFLRVLWTQMLQAVHAIHTERIIHGDLKPANFLFVNGALKLIDFGIAKAISNDTTNIERDSQVGTVNFMSPEAIQGNAGPGGQRNPQGKMKVGRASDIWSLGCILYQMVYGKPPFADLGSIIEKFRCIIDPKYEIPFPPLHNKELEDVIRKCLQRDHRARPTIDGPNGLLQHAFLKNTVTSSSAATTAVHVTLANGEVVLDQLADLLRTQGVEKSKVATFVSIGQDGLRARRNGGSNGNLASSHYQPTRGEYKYDTEERRTDI